MRLPNRVRHCAASTAALLAVTLCCAHPARAQTTDGLHAIQVFPLVVDTASFRQEFTFRNPEAQPVTLEVSFYPASGTAQATAAGVPLPCEPVPVPGHGVASRGSLRTLCPGLTSGSAFGMMLVRAPGPRRFAGFTRVDNPAGIGFAVEAFPAHTFSPATSVVTGLRRSAAQAAAPAFQSNCFVGAMPRLAGGDIIGSDVTLSVRDAAGALLGTRNLQLAPGQMVRLLDVFGATGAPAGDYVGASAVFHPVDGDNGLVAYCTVQDNTSFGADFRIAKQETDRLGRIGGFDDTAVRETVDAYALGDSLQVLDGEYAIPPGAWRDTHLYWFRNPDWLSCKLMIGHPGAQVPATPADGLEMRMLQRDAMGEWVYVVAGGDGVVAWTNLYLGDKPKAHYLAGMDYLVEVESNGQNAGALRPYGIACSSGSGQPRGIPLNRGLPPAF